MEPEPHAELVIAPVFSERDVMKEALVQERDVGGVPVHTGIAGKKLADDGEWCLIIYARSSKRGLEHTFQQIRNSIRLVN